MITREDIEREYKHGDLAGEEAVEDLEKIGYGRWAAIDWIAIWNGDIMKKQAEAFTCPRCYAVSYHPKDKEHGYCGRCHQFVETENGERETNADGTSKGSQGDDRGKAEREPGAERVLGDLPSGGPSSQGE